MLYHVWLKQHYDLIIEITVVIIDKFMQGIP